MKSFRSLSKAFTMIEALIVIVVIGVLVVIAVPAIYKSRDQTLISAQNGTARTFNDAVTRVKISGTTAQQAELQGYLNANDVTNTVNFLVSNNFVKLN